MRILPVVLGLAVGFAAPAFAALPVQTLHIDSKTKTHAITAAYPRTGQAAIDTQIAGWVKSEIANFKSLAHDTDGNPTPYTLDMNFTVKRNDEKIFAVFLEEDSYTGGAHGSQSVEAFNFLMPDGWRVFLPEIFTGAGLKKISALARADLNRRLSGPDGMSEQNWRDQGAGPVWSNFANFALLPDKLDIQFPPYAVAAYAAGPQETEIPLAALRDGMRANRRAPVPSFDCAVARTAVEHAICADVALARLDRAAADAYAAQLGVQSEAAQKAAFRDGQRRWLARRNTACGGQTGRAQTACLTGVYKERLAKLKAEP